MGDSAFTLVLLALFGAAMLLQRRRQIAELARVIGDQRLLSLLPMSYEPVDARWAPYLDGLDVPAGMMALGDFVEVPEGRSASGALRGIADRDGKTFGWIAKAGPREQFVMLLVSATATDSYATIFTPARAGLIASAPTVHRVLVSPATGIQPTLAQHRERTKAITGLVEVTTLEELQAQLRLLRTRAIEWRLAQPPAALLDADLRSMLGDRYNKYGPTLAAKLAHEIPQAKVVR